MKHDMIAKSNAEYVQALVEFAGKALRSQGSVTPMVVFDTKDGQHGALVMPYYTDNRDKHIAELRKKFQEYDVCRYGVIMESWFLETDNVKDLAVRPSQSERRQEAVMVVVIDRDGNTCSKMPLIERDAEGNPSLGEDKSKNTERMEGAMCALLE